MDLKSTVPQSLKADTAIKENANGGESLPLQYTDVHLEDETLLVPLQSLSVASKQNASSSQSPGDLASGHEIDSNTTPASERNVSTPSESIEVSESESPPTSETNQATQGDTPMKTVPEDCHTGSADETSNDPPQFIACESSDASSSPCPISIPVVTIESGGPPLNDKKKRGGSSGRKWRLLLCCGWRWRRNTTARYGQADGPAVGNQGDQHHLNGVVLTQSTLLNPVDENYRNKKCFIIDLDETLVHSSFKSVENADFRVGVEIDGTMHQVYVLKRPYVDEFLQRMGELFECVLFTASLAKYADPVADFLDKWSVFRHRLFRESCVYHRGNYVKDLNQLGRPVDQVLILDNSPASYLFHATHAVQVTSWFDDPTDRALLDLIPYFEALSSAPSVPEFLSRQRPPPSATGGGVISQGPPMPQISEQASGKGDDLSSVITQVHRT